MVHTQCDVFTSRDVCFTPNAHRVDMSRNDSGSHYVLTNSHPSRPSPQHYFNMHVNKKVHVNTQKNACHHTKIACQHACQ
jgi:hypothetical protein